MNTAILWIAIVLVAPDEAPALTRYESKFYIIHTNLPIQRAEMIGSVMDATGKEYDRLFKGFAGVVRQKPEVKVFATKEQYVAALKRAAFGGNFEFSGGVFNPTDEIVYIYDGKNLESGLRHECFHQFAHKVIGGRLPLWVNEGLAEYFADGVFIKGPNQLRVGDVPAFRRDVLRNAKEKGLLLSVKKLLTIGGHEWWENMSGPRGSVQYSQSLALCHLMIHADGGQYAGHFDKFLREIDKGNDGGSSFEKAFGRDITPLQARYDAYLDDIINGRIVRR